MPRANFPSKYGLSSAEIGILTASCVIGQGGFGKTLVAVVPGLIQYTGWKVTPEAVKREALRLKDRTHARTKSVAVSLCMSRVW